MLINEIKTNKGFRYILINEMSNPKILCSLYVLFDTKHKNNAKICRVNVKNKIDRGKGYAKFLLSFVTELYSDKYLYLNACPYGNNINLNNIEFYRKKLKKLYSLFGFKEKSKTKTVMIRFPDSLNLNKVKQLTFD